MSWEERLKNIQFSIKTGDGKTYTPLWRFSEKSKEYNTKRFEFIDADKSLIDRRKPKSGQYPLIFFFQGPDNIEQSEAFEQSADDERPWEVTHPFYGTIVGQPTSLRRIDDSYNLTTFQITFWETLTDDYPNTKISPKDAILAKTENINATALTSYVAGVKPSSSDIATLKKNSTDIAARFQRLHQQDTLVAYKNKLAKTLASYDHLITAPSTALGNSQGLLTLPSTYQLPVTTRLNALSLAYLAIRAVITGKNDKYYFESQAATLLGAMATTVVTPEEDDYVTREQLTAANTLVMDTYTDYLGTLDSVQVAYTDTENEWSPNPVLQQQLHELLMQTRANLYSLTFGAKQERLVVVDADTNLFVLTHRYMGLDAEDKNLETFRNINNIKNDELFKIKKGRIIKYYV